VVAVHCAHTAALPTYICCCPFPLLPHNFTAHPSPPRPSTPTDDRIIAKVGEAVTRCAALRTRLVAAESDAERARDQRAPLRSLVARPAATLLIAFESVARLHPAQVRPVLWRSPLARVKLGDCTSVRWHQRES